MKNLLKLVVSWALKRYYHISESELLQLAKMIRGDIPRDRSLMARAVRTFELRAEFGKDVEKGERKSVELAEQAMQKMARDHVPSDLPPEKRDEVAKKALDMCRENLIELATNMNLRIAMLIKRLLKREEVNAVQRNAVAAILESMVDD